MSSPALIISDTDVVFLLTVSITCIVKLIAKLISILIEKVNDHH